MDASAVRLRSATAEGRQSSPAEGRAAQLPGGCRTGHHRRMSTTDRHGRAARADNDQRRRPSDGFRTADRARFARVVRQAVDRLPPDLRAHLSSAELILEDVPDPDAGDVDLHGAVTLARVHLAGPALPVPRLTVFRRPLELRAERSADLAAEVGRALRRAVQEALALPPDEEPEGPT